MQVASNNESSVWKESNLLWAALSFVSLVMVFVYYEGLEEMVTWWNERPEYGHGFMIPFISAFFIWQKKDQLEKIEFTGSWLGVGLVALGLVIFFLGTFSSIFAVIQYGFLIALFGVALSLTGMKAFKVIFVPMVVLAFMIPLPNFFYNNISSELQLISSQIGVAFIRLFDISVYLEGNVIDLGVFKLQVVEACNGLRYLFPLMTLGFIAAYFFTGAFWKKTIIFLSTIPITIFMNSIRIGIIGVTVEYWGQEMAEGFLHDFEGWAVFMSCLGLLLVEMWVLASIGKNKLPLREAFGLDFPEPTPEDAQVKFRAVTKPFYASGILMVMVALSIFALPERVEIEPDRKDFIEFPVEFEGWRGRKGSIEQVYLDALKLTDYVMNDYIDETGKGINFYSAYYASQKAGVSAHSPKSCIPGGGWRITAFGKQKIEGVVMADTPLEVNRLLIQKGENKQLVYYWFQQRGRIITNEYLVKWYLLLDSLAINRSDGALMRITVMVGKNDDVAQAEERIVSFLKQLSPIMNDFIPGK
jgi:exosortase D (VPLPA-CTERM-specific)